MKVSLLYLDGCPHVELAEQALHEALAVCGRADIETERVLVSTPEQAERLQFRGSPTVLVDGRDPFADAEAPVGLTCRLYRTGAGLAGVPTVEQLVSALV